MLVVPWKLGWDDVMADYEERKNRGWRSARLKISTYTGLAYRLHHCVYFAKSRKQFVISSSRAHDIPSHGNYLALALFRLPI